MEGGERWFQQVADQNKICCWTRNIRRLPVFFWLKFCFRETEERSQGGREYVGHTSFHITFVHHVTKHRKTANTHHLPQTTEVSSFWMPSVCQAICCFVNSINRMLIGNVWICAKLKIKPVFIRPYDGQSRHDNIRRLIHQPTMLMLI